ncbi:MAG: hypothetical protein WC077_07310, partial [Bacteroidales bacterium]
MKRILLILLLVTATVSTGSAQSIEQQTKKREAIERELELLDKQLQTTKSQQKTSTRELNLIQQKVSNRRRLLSQIEADIQYIDHQSRQKEQEVKKLEKELENLRDKYKHLVYNAYKNRDKTSWILYVLASKNVEQGYRRWSYLRSYSQTMKSTAQTIRDKTQGLQKEMEKLADMKLESVSMKTQREKEYRSLAQEEKKAKEII